jgi:hypothetical protein
VSASSLGLIWRQAIFEEFEEESSDEEDEDEDEDGLITKTRGIELDDEEEEGTGVLTSQLRHFVIQVPLPFLLIDWADGIGISPSPNIIWYSPNVWDSINRIGRI